MENEKDDTREQEVENDMLCRTTTARIAGNDGRRGKGASIQPTSRLIAHNKCERRSPLR